MSFIRQRIGLTGAPSESFKLLEKSEIGMSRTLKSFIFALVGQPGFNSNLGVVPMPKWEITLQTKDPDTNGIMSVGDLGHICVVDLLPHIAVYDVVAGFTSGAFPTSVFLNFKDVKTVDPLWMVVTNLFGPVEIAYRLEFSQKNVSTIDHVLATLGVFG